ncbi:hypothetical protein CVT24_012142 [Panaeolus cyanescens]|uniref:Fungal-type protein kinase domain-containing protein n=1 Tax=Panaeolus cyanescens TaxID=181874 RepID=A0A409X162_9AGAR|nr:hypothetical protein CVT24_012142 [Panaeolus cyanescens]
MFYSSRTLPRNVDDLQAFLWVFVWILDLYNPGSDGSFRNRFQHPAAAALDQKYSFVHRCKEGDICITSRYPEGLELILNLGSFFAKKMKHPCPTTPDKLGQEANDVARGGYQIALGHFKTAIDRLSNATPVKLIPFSEVLMRLSRGISSV